MAASSSCTVIVKFVCYASMGNYQGIFFKYCHLEDRWHIPVMQINLSGIVGRTRKVKQWTRILFLKFMDLSYVWKSH